jgi:hypothetical protein
MAITTPLKCVFCTNSYSPSTYPLLKVAINSLLKNTTLQPYVVWGNHFKGESNPMIQWLQEKQIPIIQHTLSFEFDLYAFSFSKSSMHNPILKKMYEFYPEYYNQNFIISESLRMDLPWVFTKDEYILYTDCDVVFLKDIQIENFSEPIAAATRSGNFFNNGIMFLNLPELRRSHREFVNFYLKSNYTFEIGNSTTQGAYNTFYKEQVHSLPLEYNWHVFFGINDEAKIIHFCGPKYEDYQKMLNDPNADYEKIYRDCAKSPSIPHYLKEFEKYV